MGRCLLQKVPVRSRHADRRARLGLDLGRPAVVDFVRFRDEDVLDVSRVETELPDIVERPIDHKGSRRIDEHEPIGRRDQIGADGLVPNIVDIVKNLERHLDLPVARRDVTAGQTPPEIFSSSCALILGLVRAAGASALHPAASPEGA